MAPFSRSSRTTASFPESAAMCSPVICGGDIGTVLEKQSDHCFVPVAHRLGLPLDSLHGPIVDFVQVPLFSSGYLEPCQFLQDFPWGGLLANVFDVDVDLSYLRSAHAVGGRSIIALLEQSVSAEMILSLHSPRVMRRFARGLFSIFCWMYSSRSSDFAWSSTAERILDILRVVPTG